jgi:prolyl oligopeptidase
MTPRSIYRLDRLSGELAIFNAGTPTFDPACFEVKQVEYPSKDGTLVNMFIVHKRGFVPLGKNPAVLYGYGGFGYSLMPSFNSEILPLLERGGVYAIANIRGGGEGGQYWHKAGSREWKHNSFHDFAAAGRWLIENRYVSPKKLAAHGSSNGGLLVLATMLQHPSLFFAVVAGVPVTDMLRFHLFDGGIYWIREYLDPRRLHERTYLRGYSPYHNVKEGAKYPPVLIMTSEHDDRVSPLHSFKMTARLIEANSSVLLRVEKDAGHGGAASKTAAVQETADMWAFIFDHIGN